MQDRVPRQQVLRTGDEGMQAENWGFLAWRTSSRPGRLLYAHKLASVLHSRSHKRLWCSFFHNYYYEKYDTFFLNFYQKYFRFLDLFLHIPLATIYTFPMDPSAAISVENKDGKQVFLF